MRLLYLRLRATGWRHTKLKDFFITAHSKISNPDEFKQPRENSSLDDILFLHLEYHPNDVPRRQLWQAFTEECALLQEPIDDGEFGPKQLIVAYSRPRNLGDKITSSKLHEASGKEV